MTLEMILELIQLGINAASALLNHNPTALEQSLLDIVVKGNAAYQAQVGKPIDPTLIAPKDIIP